MEKELIINGVKYVRQDSLEVGADQVEEYLKTCYAGNVIGIIQRVSESYLQNEYFGSDDIVENKISSVDKTMLKIYLACESYY